MELKDVNFRFKDQVALEHINIKIFDGSFVCLMGDNGCGKSTLMKLMSGLIYAQSGEYEFNSQIITKKKLQNSVFLREFHQRVGYLFQNSEVQLFNPTVEEELKFGLIQLGVTEGEISRRISDCLSLLQINDLKNRNSFSLSGGEKKMVAIAAVLALNPSYLIFDEPFNGLSQQKITIIQNVLKQMNDLGKTIIVSSHNYNYLNDIATELITMSPEHKISYQGEILPEKEMEELIYKF